MLAAVPTIITCANSSSFIFFGIPCRKQRRQDSSGIKSNFHLGAETFTISNLPITGAIVGNHNLQKVFDILIFRYMINIITGNRYNLNQITLPSSPTAENPFFQKATSCVFSLVSRSSSSCVVINMMLVFDGHLHFRVSHLKELLGGHVCLYMISINFSVASKNPEGRISKNKRNQT